MRRERSCSSPRPPRRGAEHMPDDAPEIAAANRGVLDRSRRDVGHRRSLWTLDLAAEEAFKQGLTTTRVTGETVRATLARLGVRWLRAKTWITSPDPAYERKKGGATA